MLSVKTKSILDIALNASQGRFFPIYLIVSRNLISLPIDWKRPAKVPFYDPWKTGDGVTSLTVDMSKSPVLVEQSSELATADECVKKLFTFHFLGRKHAMIRAKNEMIESVRNHMYDNNSPEVEIACKTATIRNLMEHYMTNTIDRRAKHILNTLILKRKRRLRMLRNWDYKRYEWILDKLDLHFRPSPVEFDPVERKKSIRRLTDKYCEEFKMKKLEEYKTVLEEQKEGFLKEKIEVLKQMREQEMKYGVEPTITERDVETAEQQLAQHLEKLRLKPHIMDVNRNVLADV